MMRLPMFEFHAPKTLAEAARILEGEGQRAMLLAGGTDLLPNMKRRQQTPRTLVSLRHVASLRAMSLETDSDMRLGACLSIAEIAEERRFRNGYSALWQAAAQIATPQIRNMATLGGNLCLDTRCNYYDQNYEWRKAINFCMKKDGDICWVATASPKCMAISSTDMAPALTALGARVLLVSRAGEREVALADLYQNDGIDYLRRRPDEILAEVRLACGKGWRSAYWKLRRRGSFDFPVLSVAAAARFSPAGVVEQARIVIGSVASCPLIAAEAAAAMSGRVLDDDAIAEVAALAARIAKPLDNTDFDMTWRKRVASEFVRYALRELRGDDMSLERGRLMGRNFS